LNQTIYTLQAQQEIEQFLHQLELSKWELIKQAYLGSLPSST
jgi:hypothetical protein